MSAAILTVSEYWAIEAQSGGNEPCSGVDFNRGPIGTLVMPKSWERFKDRRILFVSNSKIDQGALIFMKTFLCFEFSPQSFVTEKLKTPAIFLPFLFQLNLNFSE